MDGRGGHRRRGRGRRCGRGDRASWDWSPRQRGRRRGPLAAARPAAGNWDGGAAGWLRSTCQPPAAARVLRFGLVSAGLADAALTARLRGSRLLCARPSPRRGLGGGRRRPLRLRGRGRLRGRRRLLRGWPRRLGGGCGRTAGRSRVARSSGSATLRAVPADTFMLDTSNLCPSHVAIRRLVDAAGAPARPAPPRSEGSAPGKARPSRSARLPPPAATNIASQRRYVIGEAPQASAQQPAAHFRLRPSR